jgi:hypothetical protein
MSIIAAGNTLERLVLVHGAPAGADSHALYVRGDRVKLHLVAVAMERPHATEADGGPRSIQVNGGVKLRECLLLGEVMMGAPGEFTNCLLLGRFSNAHQPCRLRFCTVSRKIQFVLPGSAIVDSIVGSAHIYAIADFRMHNCNVYGAEKFYGHPHPKTGYFHASPQFRDPANLDYRLLPDSPCLGKASDGGDLGCRYTPEMLEMIEKALELRAQGVLKF